MQKPAVSWRRPAGRGLALCALRIPPATRPPTPPSHSTRTHLCHVLLSQPHPRHASYAQMHAGCGALAARLAARLAAGLAAAAARGRGAAVGGGGGMGQQLNEALICRPAAVGAPKQHLTCTGGGGSGGDSLTTGPAAGCARAAPCTGQSQSALLNPLSPCGWRSCGSVSSVMAPEA